MNPFLIMKAIRDAAALVDQANRMAGPDRRWSLAYNNRSFWSALIGVAATLAAAFGLPFPIPLDIAAEVAWTLVSIAGMAWALIERLMGKTRAVWNPTQGAEAVQEADALTAALNKVPGVDSQLPR